MLMRSTPPTCRAFTLLCCVAILVGLSILIFVKDELNMSTFKLNRFYLKDDIKYKERRATLMKACEGSLPVTTNTKLPMRRLSLDHQHRLVYCPVPKVASTFWKRVIQVSSGVKSASSPFDIKNAHDGSLKNMFSMPIEKRQTTLNNYTTFLFVREPYSRLFSCFIDKFFTINIYFWKLGGQIIEMFRPNATTKSISCGNDVTFPEFIKFVINSIETGHGLNEHWLPIYECCRPCQIHYDIIGKLETLTSDVDYLLQNHLKGDVLLTEMETESARDIIVQKVHFLFDRYKKVSENCLSLNGHLERFLKQQQIRGLIGKSVELSDRLANKKHVSVDDFEKFVLSAYEGKDDKEKRKLNRKEALLEAYSDVPLEDMIKLQKLFQLDFEMFGYDLRPDELYNEKIRKETKKFYFNL